MTLRRCSLRHRAGFTLVELLTVVGIIALLIGILLPSMGRARIQARKGATAATLKAIGDGFEMFHNNFRHYPDSRYRRDPITDFGGAPPNANHMLSGAHWMARALIGHDFQGVDAEGLVMGDGAFTSLTVADLMNVDRKGTYLGGDVYARDSDTRFAHEGDFVATGRPVLFDSFDFPILYYRANPRAKQWLGPTAPAIYVQQDNAAITGSDVSSMAAEGWDFGGVGALTGIPIHPMGQIGTYTASDPHDVHDPPTGGITGKTFADFLHHHGAGDIGTVLKPHNPDRFVLISAGPDGSFGTDDDVTNFKNAL